jgi:L-asparagine transporter-like permease
MSSPLILKPYSTEYSTSWPSQCSALFLSTATRTLTPLVLDCPSRTTMVTHSFTRSASRYVSPKLCYRFSVSYDICAMMLCHVQLLLVMCFADSWFYFRMRIPPQPQLTMATPMVTLTATATVTVSQFKHFSCPMCAWKLGHMRLW